MFSGIVETLGHILAITSESACKHFKIAPLLKFDDLSIGDSIAVNGICLTVRQFDADSFQVTAVPETLRLSNLDRLAVGSKVNLERSLKVTARLGGHFVQGHIDGLGRIIDLKQDSASTALIARIALPAHLTKYIIPKGFVAIDGMSITVIESDVESFTVTFIPHTQTVTLTQDYALHTELNIEVDMMGKYIEKILGAHTHAIPH